MKQIKDWAKKRKITAIIILIIILGGGYYWYQKAHTSSKTVQYKTAVAEKGTLTVSVSGSGNVVVDQSSNIDPTISGTVKNLSVSVGDKVKKGQVLFEIDNNDLSVNVSKARSSYLSSLAALENAKASKNDAHNTYDDATSKTALASKRRYDAAKISLEAAEENVKSASENYQNEQKNYSDRIVTSPIDGTVNEINIKNGDDLSKLSSGSSREIPIIIGDLGTMKAQVQLSEVDISSVEIGQETMLTFNAIDGFTATGKVEKMDSIGTLTSGVVTYNVIVNFDSLDSRIKPEMSVSASIITDSKQNAVIVPSGAVKLEGNGYYVDVMENGVPVSKTVEIGLENTSKTEITSGIKEGDAVVTQTINSSSSSSTSSSSSSSSNSGGRGGMGIPGM
jgi:RND family efflux transporter MFP subunit